MTRVKGGVKSKRKHKKFLAMAKGYWRKHSSTIRKAKETLLHAGQYAFAGRKLKKRNFRELWIIRINAAVRELGMSYSTFVGKLHKSKMEVDRKILAQIAVEHPKAFTKIVESMK